MASNSTISATFKLNVDAKSLKELTKDSDGLRKALEGAVAEADKAPAKMNRLNSAAKNIAGSFAKMAAGFIGLQAAVAGLRNIMDTLIGFEKANSELASVLGTNIQGVEELSKAAQELGRSTMYSAGEVTALQTSLARLGFTKGQIQDMEGAILKFAAATGTDLASAADFTGASLRSFGLEANKANDLLDMMAKSTSASALSFSKLQVAMSIVGPVANAFGVTATDTVALLGVLANAGFDASSGATALRNILLNLADSNGKLAKGLGHTAKTMPEIIAALLELNESGVDLNTTLQMTDKRSVAAFNALIDGADSVGDLYEQLQNANGALNEMYNTMTDNVAGAIDSVKSAWEGLVLTMSKSTGPLKKVLSDFAGGLNIVTSMIGGLSWSDARKNLKVEALMNQFSESQIQSIYDQLDKKNRNKKEDELYNVAAAALTRFALQNQMSSLNSLFVDIPSLPDGGNGGGNGGGSSSKTKLGRKWTTNMSGVEAYTDRKFEEVYRNITAAAEEYNDVLFEMDPALLATVQAMREQAEASLSAERNMLMAETTFETLGSVMRDFSSVVGEGASAWLDWGANLMTAVSQAIPKIMALVEAKRASANASLEEAAAASAASVAGIPIVGAGMALAAIAGVVASLMSIPKFANGGIAFGPTIGMFGEYAGASHNPEVVAPLDRLRAIIGDSSAGGQVEFKIDGRTLVGVLKRQNDFSSRT